jgi:murein DD-endopeptidase MepM/ murein hydrolase activator NlpD
MRSGAVLRCRVATIAAVLLSAIVTAVPASAQAAAGSVADYLPPVDAPVTDGFRPPQSRYGPGNRGLQYGVSPGEVVRSAAAGQVTFAGRIGAASYVTVRHADGVRTTYSFLVRVEVRAGQSVRAGEPVGRAGPSFHFGARIGRAYLDPAILLAGGQPGPVRVHLVPVPDDRRRG